MKRFDVSMLVKAGFERRQDLDFRDDGNSFRGFSYKGMPISYLKADGRYYLSVRVDYLDNDFTYEDLRKQPWYELTDEFNGCSEIDVEKLVNNIETILEGIDKLDEMIALEVLSLDSSAFFERVDKEIEYANNMLENVKGFDWLNDNVSDRDIDDVRKCARFIKGKIKVLKFCCNLPDVKLRQEIQRFEKNGYVCFEDNDESYFVKRYLKLISK